MLISHLVDENIKNNNGAFLTQRETGNNNTSHDIENTMAWLNFTLI